MSLSKLGFGDKSLKVDITFEDSLEVHYSPVFYSIESINLIKNKMLHNPFMKPLVILLKKLLSIHNLNVSFHGIYPFTHIQED